VDMKDDLISRQAAIDAIDRLDIPEDMCVFEILSHIELEIGNLPSAQPERKRGKWIEDDDGWDEVIWRCSECDAVFTLVDGTPKENEYYFCPHCGADMRGEQDG